MTKEEYEAIKKRVEKGQQVLKGKFLDPKYKVWVNEYERLAQQMLDYEIENDLLPI